MQMPFHFPISHKSRQSRSLRQKNIDLIDKPQLPIHARAPSFYIILFIYLLKISIMYVLGVKNFHNSLYHKHLMTLYINLILPYVSHFPSLETVGALSQCIRFFPHKTLFL